ncbi:MAG: tetratricopeptide repeat protein [Chloroflexi bacterium]|nr:tetratricopeptide repeat protein [Chloroflexota bacterium]
MESQTLLSRYTLPALFALTVVVIVFRPWTSIPLNIAAVIYAQAQSASAAEGSTAPLTRFLNTSVTSSLASSWSYELLRARALDITGQHAAAVTLLKDIVRQHPDDSVARLLLADAEEHAGQSAVAVKERVTAAMRIYSDPAVFYGLASAYASRNPEQSIAFGKVAMQLDPGLWQAADLVGQLQFSGSGSQFAPHSGRGSSS